MREYTICTSDFRQNKISFDIDWLLDYDFLRNVFINVKFPKLPSGKAWIKDIGKIINKISFKIGDITYHFADYLSVLVNYTVQNSESKDQCFGKMIYSDETNNEQNIYIPIMQMTDNNSLDLRLLNINDYKHDIDLEISSVKSLINNNNYSSVHIPNITEFKIMVYFDVCCVISKNSLIENTQQLSGNPTVTLQPITYRIIDGFIMLYSHPLMSYMYFIYLNKDGDTCRLSQSDNKLIHNFQQKWQYDNRITQSIIDNVVFQSDMQRQTYRFSIIAAPDDIPCFIKVYQVISSNNHINLSSIYNVNMILMNLLEFEFKYLYHVIHERKCNRNESYKQNIFNSLIIKNDVSTQAHVLPKIDMEYFDSDNVKSVYLIHNPLAVVKYNITQQYTTGLILCVLNFKSDTDTCCDVYACYSYNIISDPHHYTIPKHCIITIYTGGSLERLINIIPMKMRETIKCIPFSSQYTAHEDPNIINYPFNKSLKQYAHDLLVFNNENL